MFGDISGLDARGRLDYVAKLCESLGLNPLGRAFSYINFGQGDTCYLTSMGASQLRTVHGISITKVEDHGVVDDFYRITITGGTLNGRTDIEFGSIAMKDKQGNWLVGVQVENARKKCLTQAKSRLTKSLVGLSGMPAEDEKDDFGERWSSGPTPESLAAQRINQETREVTEPAEPIISQEQFDRIGNLWKILREQFGKTSPARGVIGKYTAARAEHEIAKLTDDLTALQARKAAQEADPIVPQNTDEDLDFAFPEIPAHVGTP